MIKKTISLVVIALTLMAFSIPTSKKYKCMIQMKNYTGEGAYVVISLINPEGLYEKTLYVQGDDEEWYHDITIWWNFQGKIRSDIDAITGETISGGNRAISVIEIDDSYIDAGYKLRFETAVEDQEYYEKDVEINLTAASLKGKAEGAGFIRYVRLMPQ